MANNVICKFGMIHCMIILMNNYEFFSNFKNEWKDFKRVLLILI